MGLFSGLKNAVKWVGGKIVEGVVTVVDCTLEVCQTVAQAAADGIQWLQDKIEHWRPKNPPVEPVYPEAKEADEKLIDPVVKKIEEHFPTGISNFVEQTTEEKRAEKIAELVPVIAQTMGIKNIPEVEFYVPEDEEIVSYGAYNWRENKLKLNLAMAVSNDKEIYKEQVSTVLHELIHARQIGAVKAWICGESIEEYGYQGSYIHMLANNMFNYITIDESPEAYIKQPLEAEAFWFESKVKPSLN